MLYLLTFLQFDLLLGLPILLPLFDLFFDLLHVFSLLFISFTGHNKPILFEIRCLKYGGLFSERNNLEQSVSFFLGNLLLNLLEQIGLVLE